MKCKFCNAEMLEGKDKCDYCGEYQHDVVEEKKESNSNDENKKSSNKSKIFMTIFEVLVCLVIVGVGIYFLLQYFDSQYLFYGRWNCPNGQYIIDVDSSDFKMEYSKDNYEKANYILEEKSEKDDIKTYLLNVSATKTLINGSTITNKNYTKFQIEIDKKNNGVLLLKNLTTDEEMKCYKLVKE